MKTTKKVISFVLALAMLTGVFSMMSFAGGTESAVDLYIDCDKTSYSAGDEVVLTFSEQVVDAVGDMLIAGSYVIAYNNTVFSAYSTSVELTDHGFTGIKDGYDTAASSIILNDALVGMGDTIDATGANSHNWNEIIAYGVAPSDPYVPFSATTKTALFSIKLKLNAGVPDGDYVIGFNKPSYVNYNGFSADNANGGVYGYDDDLGYGTTANYSFGTCTIHVGAAAPAYSVTSVKSQVKFTGTKPTPDDAFSYRLISKISAADLTAMNSGSNTITELGFIAANADATDLAAAKAAVVAGTALPTGWTKSAPTTYISQADASSDGLFGCRLNNISHATQDKDITCAAYVAYSDGATTHYVWYTSPVVAKVYTNYNTAVETWKNS